MIDWNYFKRMIAVSMIITLPVEAVEVHKEKIQKKYNKIEYVKKQKHEESHNVLSNSFYLRPYYNGGWVGKNHFKYARSSAIPVTKNDSGSIVDGSIFDYYKPEYKPGFLGGGLAIGFITNSGIGFELEGIQSQEFKVKNKNDKYFYYLQNDNPDDRDEPEASQKNEDSIVTSFKNEVKEALDAIKALYAAPGGNGLSDVQTLLGASVAGTGTLTIAPGEAGAPSYTGAVSGPINGELKLNRLQSKIVIDDNAALDTAVATAFEALNQSAEVTSKSEIDAAKDSIKELYVAANANGLKDIAGLLGSSLTDGISTLAINPGSAGSGATYVGNSAVPSGLNGELKLNNLQSKIVINDAGKLDASVNNVFNTIVPANGSTQDEISQVGESIKSLYKQQGSNGITSISGAFHQNATGRSVVESFDDANYSLSISDEYPGTNKEDVPRYGRINEQGSLLVLNRISSKNVINDPNALDNAVNTELAQLKPSSGATQAQINNAKASLQGLYATANSANGLVDIKTLIPTSINGTNGNLAVTAGDISKAPEFSVTAPAIPASGTLTLNDIGTKLAIDDKGALDAAVENVFGELVQVSMSPKEDADIVEANVKALYAVADPEKGVIGVETYLGASIAGADGSALTVSTGDAGSAADPEYFVDPATIIADGTLTLNDAKDKIVIDDKSSLDAAIDAIFAALPEEIAPAQEALATTKPIGNTIESIEADEDSESDEAIDENSPEEDALPVDSSSGKPSVKSDAPSNPLANTKIPVKYINNGFKYTAGMLNMYYSMSIGDGVFNPYFGGGVGLAKVTVKGFDDKESVSLPFAIQGKIGAMFNFNKGLIPYFGYRVLYIAEKEFLSPMDSSKITVDGKKYADAALDKSSENALDQDVYALGKYSKKIHASYLLHNIEAGFVIPFKV